MINMFKSCSSLLFLPDISKWNTFNAKKINKMFSKCSSLTSLPDISKWNTKNIIDIGGLFSGCSSLLSIPDISKWNTPYLKNIDYLMMCCFSLISLPDIYKLNAINNLEKDLQHSLFDNCFSIITIPEQLQPENEYNKMNPFIYKSIQNMLRPASEFSLDLYN